MIFRNDPVQAVAEVRRVEQLDPASISLAGKVMIGWVFTFAHDPDSARRYARQILAADPNYYHAYYILGISALGESRPAEAIAPFEKAHALSHDSTSLAYLASAYARAGQQAKARALLSEMQQKARREYVPPMRFAWVYANLGEADSAFAALEKSYEDRDGMLWWTRWSPMIDPLRSDPRFPALLKKIGLPD